MSSGTKILEDRKFHVSFGSSHGQIWRKNSTSASTFKKKQDEKVGRWKMMENDGKWWKMMENDGKWWKVMESDGKWWKVMENDGKWWKVMENDGKWWKMMENDGKWWKMMENDGKWWKQQIKLIKLGLKIGATPSTPWKVWHRVHGKNRRIHGDRIWRRPDHRSETSGVWKGGKVFIGLYLIYHWWVVWNMFYCPFHIWNVILPIDELIFFKMVIAPPTRSPFLMGKLTINGHFQ